MCDEVKKLLFSCKGRIDEIIADTVNVTLFKSEHDDDPRGVAFNIIDFPEGIEEGRWFIYEQYQYQIGNTISWYFNIHLFSDERYTEKDAKEAYENYLKILPEKF